MPRAARDRLQLTEAQPVTLVLHSVLLQQIDSFEPGRSAGLRHSQWQAR